MNKLQSLQFELLFEFFQSISKRLWFKVIVYILIIGIFIVLAPYILVPVGKLMFYLMDGIYWLLEQTYNMFWQ